MKNLAFIRSLMEFNKRVLHQGGIERDQKYTMEDLQQKLFFNQVFMGNTHELFQRYPDQNIIDDYVECLNVYIRNIVTIESMLNSVKGIKIKHKSSFESRLAIESLMQDCLITKWYKLKDFTIQEAMRENLIIDGQLTYLSIYSDIIGITFIDPKRLVYQTTINMKFDGYTSYWKTDDMICDYLNRKFGVSNTVVIKPTMNPDRKVTKVEFNRDSYSIERIKDKFSSTTLILSNPYLYIDDLKKIVGSKVKDVTIQKPRFVPMDLESVFEKDRLIEYPLDSFDQYLQFLYQAAHHPHVDEIYLTLYRVGNDPSIFYILRDAVANGIKVYVNIELCASGETINTLWMNEMMKAGITVTTFAFQEMKVHSKLTLIHFDNNKSICQIGTGNYHSKTTSQYTDFSLLTADPMICKSVSIVFQILRDVPVVEFSRDLLVAPYNLRSEILRLIRLEANKGEAGYIAFKCNALDDDDISVALKNAASKGCKIDLVVRGVCTCIPDQIGQNVMVKSIIWDKLEHSRVYCFGNVNPTVYLGSADLVTKKMNQRVETLVKVKDPDVRVRIIEYLNRYITNTKNSWLMTRTGMYIKED